MADVNMDQIIDSSISKQFDRLPPHSLEAEQCLLASMMLDKEVIGQAIQDIVTINGVRVELEDGTWGLVRASSNKPSLVVVVESPVSDRQMHAIFGEIDQRLREYPEVGQYDQVL